MHTSRREAVRIFSIATGLPVLIGVLAIVWAMILLLDEHTDSVSRIFAVNGLAVVLFAVVVAHMCSSVVRKGDRVRINGLWYDLSRVRRIETMDWALSKIPVISVVNRSGHPKRIVIKEMRLGFRGDTSEKYARLKQLLELD